VLVGSDNPPHSYRYWMMQRQSPKWRAWSGFAFEGICLKHVQPIKVALGISGVQTTEAPWRHRPAADEPGPQIDLLIDRALMLAAQHCHVETGKLLLGRDAEIDARKDDGGTALIVAASNGRADFCRLLMDNGASKQVQCIRGYTPATWASGAANIPALLPALFDVETFSAEAVRKKCGNTSDTLPITIAALVCASDLALREGAFALAREQLETAMAEISGRATDSAAPVLRHLVLPRLVSVCGAMQDYTAQAKFQHDFIELLRERSRESDLLAVDLTNELPMRCWWQLLAGAHAPALSAGEEGVRRLAGEEASSPARLNLAHAYLFNDQFEKARAIYAKYLRTAFEDGRQWNDELRNDFKLLREAGHDHSDMKKIEAMLEAGE